MMMQFMMMMTMMIITTVKARVVSNTISFLVLHQMYKTYCCYFECSLSAGGLQCAAPFRSPKTTVKINFFLLIFRKFVIRKSQEISGLQAPFYMENSHLRKCGHIVPPCTNRVNPTIFEIGDVSFPKQKVL